MTANPLHHVIIGGSSGIGLATARLFACRGASVTIVGRDRNRLAAAGGAITFITAASSRLANPGTSGLAAINGALERMVPTLARELAPLRVNAVSPGVIDTAWWADKPAGLFETASRMAPLARAGQADEVADAVASWPATASSPGWCWMSMAACT